MNICDFQPAQLVAVPYLILTTVLQHCGAGSLPAYRIRKVHDDEILLEVDDGVAVVTFNRSTASTCSAAA